MATPISIPKGYTRLDNFAIDSSSIYTSMTDLNNYITTNATCYQGQILAYCNTTDGSVQIYKVRGLS